MVHGGAGSADRRIGLVIGDYVITKKLAEGGMGAVYLAENRPTGVKLIVKFMLAEFVANPALRERFEREIRAAVRLKGKTNIVEIYSCNERDGEMYMTMEYLQGETLQDHVRRCGRISVHHAFRLIAQIIAALHELHETGIIHRDLKPANIFVVPTDSEAYRVKLIDFGIIHDRQAVTAGAQKTQHGALVGTPGYMALEQFGNAGNVTPAADVFALAVIIWEMFTGQLPWSAPNEFALYEQQKGARPVLPHGHHLPEGWQPVIFQALSPNPSDRPPLHAFLYALARAVPAEPPIPNGFEMVVRYAPKVLRNTPVEIETVRASDAQRAAAAYWGIQRATAVPQTGPNVHSSASDGIPISMPGYTPASMPTVRPPADSPSDAPATVNARPSNPTPVPPIAKPQTTLSAASGVSVMPPPSVPPSRARRTWVAAIVAGAGAVALLALAISMGRSRASGTQATGAASQSTAAVDAAGAEMQVDAQPEAIPPADAATPGPEATTAPPADAATDTNPGTDAKPNRKLTQPSRGTRSTSGATGATRAKPPRESTVSAPNPPTNPQPSGSATTRKYDPNAPLGED